MYRNLSIKLNPKYNKTDTGSKICGNYILIYREWKRSIDRGIDRVKDRVIDRVIDGVID